MKLLFRNNIVALTVCFIVSGNCLVMADESIAVPGAQGGVSFDDLIYSTELKKIVVPSGSTARTLLIDPSTREVTAVGVLSTVKEDHRPPFKGVTSADVYGNTMFMINRSTGTASAWNIAENKLISEIKLQAGPDFVRYVPQTREVWVTQPSKWQIEVLSYNGKTLEHADVIVVPGGPEALLIDPKSSRAFTLILNQGTVLIDLKSRRIVEAWPNGCPNAHGLALDNERGFLITGSSAGGLVVVDVNEQGKYLGSVDTAAAGIDVIGYDPKTAHVYLAAGKAGKISVVELSPKGVPELVGVINVPPNVHCAAADETGGIWACDPDGGRVLYFKDEF